jgi:hypothetical protein
MLQNEIQMRAMPGCFLPQAPIGYPNAMMAGMQNGGQGQSMFSNDIFGVPTNMSAMEMMNSELMQKTLLNQN